MSFKFQKILLAILLTIVSELTLGKGAEFGCEIPLGSSQYYRYQFPLAFKPNGELYPTEKKENQTPRVVIENGETAILSCGPNFLRNFIKKEQITVKCNGATGNFSVVSDENNGNVEGSSITEYSCDLRVIEEVLVPVNGCTNEKWTSTNFGYFDPKRNMAHILGESCYDMNVGKTIFVHANLGRDSSHIKEVEKNFFTTKQHEHPTSRYKIEFFRKLKFDEIYNRFRTDLESNQIPLFEIGHFIDDPLLSHAQFHSVKKLSWNYFLINEELRVLETLKQDIKTLSETYNLELYIGSHGVNQVNGSNGKKLQFFVDDNDKRFPVPELIWILVKHQDKAIAFGIYNDPANTIVSSVRSSLCYNVCDKITWLIQTRMDNVNRNPLLCCEVAEFKNAIEEVPNIWSDVKSILV